MIIGAVEFDVPGGECGVESVVIAVQVEACFLYENSVRVFGEVCDVCQYLAASCFAVGVFGVGGKGGDVIGGDGEAGDGRF